MDFKAEGQNCTKSRFLKIEVGGKIGRVLTRPTRPVSPGLNMVVESSINIVGGVTKLGLTVVSMQGRRDWGGGANFFFLYHTYI